MIGYVYDGESLVGELKHTDGIYSFVIMKSF